MDSVSRANGGIFEAEKRLQQTLHGQMGITTQVVGLFDPYTAIDQKSWQPLVPITCSTKGPAAFGYAPKLVDVLLHANADLAYFAGLWKYPSVAALRWANQTRKPFMVAPHGMLDPWAVRNSGTKKKIAAWLFQDTQLKKATCVRALCQAEATAIRAYGLKNPICIIPNGIDLPSIDHAIADSPFPADKKVLLYLGRLHPKKGLSKLLEAWNKMEQAHLDSWMLAIAGWDQGGHEMELRRQATELGIRWGDLTASSSPDCSLVFLGPQFGDAKSKLYSNCDAFILPSLSEGLPMVVLEAWAYGKPVLMTPECNLPEGFTTDAALYIEPTADRIAEGLKTIFEMSGDERKVMGVSGLALVKDRFTWSKIASSMTMVYKWMLGEANQPECVIDG